MTIKIEPYSGNKNLENSNIPHTYWSVYLDDKEISITTSKEKAIETKEWMEEWLNN